LIETGNIHPGVHPGRLRTASPVLFCRDGQLNQRSLRPTEDMMPLNARAMEELAQIEDGLGKA
jgi:hypothetical protein